MLNLIRGTHSRRTRRQQKVLTDASRAHAVELLEKKTLLTIPDLNSLADAPVEVFLDFDGHTETDPSWTRLNGGNDIVTPPFDLNGDYDELTDFEIQRIRDIHAIVAEDFSLFDVNVTTIDPGSNENFETINVVMGGDGAWFGGGGGVALLNSFSNSASNTVFAFTENNSDLISSSLTASHEAGHALGLEHHSLFDDNGNKVTEYHPGNAEFGPIMGAPFRSRRGLWNDGPANTTVDALQDDLERMTRAGNRTFKYRNDLQGDTIDDAFAPPFDTNGIMQVEGVLERHDDSDVFEVETDAGEITFDITVVDIGVASHPGNNLNAVARLLDANGEVLVESSPTDSYGASLSYQAQQGTYYVEVTSDGMYGSAGQYTFNGDIIPLPTTPEMLTPVGIIEDATPRFTWTQASGVETYTLQVNSIATGQDVLEVGGITGTSFVPSDSLPEGKYQARVQGVTVLGQRSSWSEYLAFEVDVAPPGVPTLVTPRGRIEDPFTPFVWEAATDAASYDLQVTSRDTGEVTIFRTGIRGVTYTHFRPHADGNYEWTARAVNEVGERGVWASPRTFTMANARAGVPEITNPDDGTKTSARRPWITWTPTVAAVSYELRVDNLSTGQRNVIRRSDIKQAQYRPPKKLDQGVYAFSVRAFDAVGRPTDWSPVEKATIDIPRPTKPTLTSPDSLVDTQYPTFTWTRARRAKRYELVVVDENRDDATVLRKTIQGGTTLSYTSTVKLPQSTRLVALLRSVNEVGEVSKWSQLSFGIDVPVPGRPKVTGPRRNTNGTTDDRTPTYAWTETNAAHSYDLKVVDLETRKTVLREKSLKTNSFTAEQPLDEKRYRVVVRARNSAGEFSRWSRAYEFVIDEAVPDTPDMFGPQGTVTARRPTFRWENVRAHRFILFVRDLATNSTRKFSVRSWDVNDAGTEASFRIPDRLGKSTYETWVQAVNSGNEKSAYSNSVGFTIVSSEGVVDPADFVTPEVPETPVATPASEPEAPPQVEFIAQAQPETAEEGPSAIVFEQTASPVESIVQVIENADTDVRDVAIAQVMSSDWWTPEAIVDEAETEESTESSVAVGTGLILGAAVVPSIAGRLFDRMRDRRKRSGRN